MTGLVDLVEGQKAPVSCSGGSGNPLGTVIAVHSNVCPIGYLPCNGAAFDINQFPALYTLLGDNHTPEDGFELDWANAESVTLSTSNYVVTKNGWLAGWCISNNNVTAGIQVNGVIIAQTNYASNQYIDGGDFQIAVKKGDVVKVTGTLLRQSVSLVPYKYFKCIKAVTGLDETQQDYMFEVIRRAGSYSTEEIATGKTWIDGKPIYRKVVDFGNLPNATEKLVAHNISNIDKYTHIYGVALNSSNENTYPLPFGYPSNDNSIGLIANLTNVRIVTAANLSPLYAYVILEYTKTTPST